MTTQPSPPISAFFHQGATIAARLESTEHTTLLYAYQRSRETSQNDDLGQDFLAFQYDDSRLVFAVCDGVSNSFLGNIAARYLGSALIKWQWHIKTSDTSEKTLHSGLVSALSRFTQKATQHVLSQPLPDSLLPILRGILEEKRTEVGSETTFVCGYLDNDTGRLFLAWMGDTRFKLWKGNSAVQSITPVFDVKDRWSSLHGPEGRTHVHVVENVRDYDRITVYTDGVLSYENALADLTPNSLNRLLELLDKDDRSDDVTILDIRLESEKKQQKRIFPTPLSIDGDLISWKPGEDAVGWYRLNVKSKKSDDITSYDLDKSITNFRFDKQYQYALYTLSSHRPISEPAHLIPAAKSPSPQADHKSPLHVEVRRPLKKSQTIVGWALAVSSLFAIVISGILLFSQKDRNEIPASLTPPIFSASSNVANDIQFDTTPDYDIQAQQQGDCVRLEWYTNGAIKVEILKRQEATEKNWSLLTHPLANSGMFKDCEVMPVQKYFFKITTENGYIVPCILQVNMSLQSSTIVVDRCQHRSLRQILRELLPRRGLYGAF